MQSGMNLRNRQLPGAVPVVQNQVTESGSIWGSVKKAWQTLFGSALKSEKTVEPNIDEHYDDEFVDCSDTQLPPSDSQSHSTPKPLHLLTPNDLQNVNAPVNVNAGLFGQQRPIPRLYSHPSPQADIGYVPQQSGILPSTPEHHYHNCTINMGPQNSFTSFNAKGIPTYDGTTDLEAFMANFNALTKGISDDKKLLVLREKLKGKAGKVLEGLDLQGSQVSLQQLTTALFNTLIGERSEWMTRLRDIRRETDESLDDLAHRIRVYSNRAYGRHEDLGLHFYLALRETPLGDKLYLVKDQSLDIVLAQAKAYESHCIAAGIPVTSRPQIASASIPDPPSQSDRGRSNFRGHGRGRGRGSSTSNRRYGNNDRRRGTCHYCKQPGHYVAQCEAAKRVLYPGANGHDLNGAAETQQ